MKQHQDQIDEINLISTKQQRLDEHTQKQKDIENKKNQKLNTKKQNKQLRFENKQQRIADKKASLNIIESQIENLAGEQKLPVSSWYKLDNAGLIFPAAAALGGSFMFRVAALLKEPVDPLILQKAINLTVGRFPTMIAAIRRGVFWYYLEAPSIPIMARKLNDYPCKQVPLDSRHSQMNITYYVNEIAVEVFHSATDGTGALQFLNCLLACYLGLKGVKITYIDEILNHQDVPTKNELEDSFVRFSDKKKRKRDILPDAYKFNGTPFGNTKAIVYVKGICKASQVKKIASNFNATITQFLAACFIKSLHNNKKQQASQDPRPTNLMIPVNLRKLYGSTTLRNFSLVMHIDSFIDQELPEIINLVKETFVKQYTDEFMQTFMNSNIKLSKNPLIKYIPLPLKDIAMAIGYKILSGKGTTSSFSNLGINKTPPEFDEHIYRFEFTFGQQNKSSLMLSSITFNDIMTITITKGIIETDLEQSFFRQLSAFGIEIAIESNISDRYRKEGI